MDFRHTEDRTMLAEMLGRYFSDSYSFEQRCKLARSPTGDSRSHWQALSELGVVGALFAEDVGGYGGAGFDIAAVFEQIGRFLVVEPFLGTVMAGYAMGAAAPAPVVSGEQIVAFAHQESTSRYALEAVSMRAEPKAGGWILHGTKAVVPSLGAADHILVSARTATGLSLFLVRADAPGVSKRCYALIDGGAAGELTLDGAVGDLVGEDGAALPRIETAVAAGIVALCWEAIGVMDVVKTSTLEYLRTRTQFGVPIGKFQALQHRMATVALEIEQARSAAINAAAALHDERTGRERAASAAKFTINRVGLMVAEEAIQLHGGIGMTSELPLSHYAKRLMMIGHQLGDEDHHLERFIALGAAA